MKEKGYRGKRGGERGDQLISMLDYLLMVDVSVVHPAELKMIKRASEQQGSAARAQDESKQRDHAAEGTLCYTFVPFSVESQLRLGV